MIIIKNALYRSMPMAALLLSVTVVSLFAQTVNLYPGKIPNSKETADNETSEENGGILRVGKISRPTLTIFPLKEKHAEKHPAIIICPGGGYWINAINIEGTDVAKEFTMFGVVAFVLKYRIPNDETMTDKSIGPIQDAQQAIRYVRENAATWNVDPSRVGILGFSAGGHLASTASTHFHRNYIEGSSPVNLRPDFSILLYPVISFTDSLGHRGSRDQLIGTNPTKEKIMEYSNEQQITRDTPPAFLVHASDDNAVPPGNSIAYYQGLLRNGVLAELHIYQKGGHGFGLKNKTTNDKWMDRCHNWLISAGILPPSTH